MYLEGYEEEGIVERSDGPPSDPTVVDESKHRAGGTTITDRKHHADFSMVPGELAAFGIPERTL